MMRKVVLPVKQDVTENENGKKEEAVIEDEAPQLQNKLPSEILQIIRPALTIGAFAGMFPRSIDPFSLFLLMFLFYLT